MYFWAILTKKISASSILLIKVWRLQAKRLLEITVSLAKKSTLRSETSL